MTTETTTIVESFAGSRSRVDTTAGVIYGVKLIGFESKNGRSYPPDVLRSAVHHYEGLKVNVDHPRSPGDPRRVADRIGVIRKARFDAAAGLVGDFHFNPKHQLAEQIAWDAANNPAALGFSHNATLRIGGTTAAGKKAVESIIGVRSLDLVADPATTSGFFESVAQPAEPIDWLKRLTGRPTPQAALESAGATPGKPADTEWLRRIRRRGIHHADN